MQDRECDSAAAHAAAGGGGGVLRAVNHAAVVCKVQLLPLVHPDLGWHVACSGELSIQALPLSAYDVYFFPLIQRVAARAICSNRPEMTCFIYAQYIYRVFIRMATSALGCLSGIHASENNSPVQSDQDNSAPHWSRDAQRLNDFCKSSALDKL